MNYIHIVNGDSAGGVLQQALAHAGRRGHVVASRVTLIAPISLLHNGRLAPEWRELKRE